MTGLAIWGAMSIPFLGFAILLLFFHHRMKWWEFGIPFVVSALLCVGFKLMAEHGATRDFEYWGGYVVSSHYFEHWNEYIQQTCEQCVSYDKDGFCDSTITYDCSYVRDHSPYWEIADSNGEYHLVDQNTYAYFVKLFGMKPQFVDMHRHYHNIDGDQYRTLWPKTDETVRLVVTKHTYENRIQASRSVFSYQNISDEEAKNYGLFDYPEVSLLNTPSILGNCGGKEKAANEKLSFYNATLGAPLQLRIWMLCFQGGDLEKGHQQEAYWVGGNKNEVVVAVGTSEDGSVRWVHPFSWTDNKAPLYEIRDFIAGQKKFDPLLAAEFIGPTLRGGFVRKQFKEFSYLTVEPPTWAVVVTYVVTILVNLVLSFWLVNNEFHDDKRGYYYYN